MRRFLVAASTKNVSESLQEDKSVDETLQFGEAWNALSDYPAPRFLVDALLQHDVESKNMYLPNWYQASVVFVLHHLLELV